MSRLLHYLLILILFIVCGSVTHATETERFVTVDAGYEKYGGTERIDNLVTWVYDGTSFTPVAKVAGGERYTIVHDYLGTPVQAYDSGGNLVWEMLLDVYGEVMESRGDRSLVPFRYQGSTRTKRPGCTTTASATTPRRWECTYPLTLSVLQETIRRSMDMYKMSIRGSTRAAVRKAKLKSIAVEKVSDIDSLTDLSKQLRANKLRNIGANKLPTCK